jgi:hypothetical protein
MEHVQLPTTLASLVTASLSGLADYGSTRGHLKFGDPHARNRGIARGPRVNDRFDVERCGQVRERVRE